MVGITSPSGSLTVPRSRPKLAAIGVSRASHRSHILCFLLVLEGCVIFTGTGGAYVSNPSRPWEQHLLHLVKPDDVRGCVRGFPRHPAHAHTQTHACILRQGRRGGEDKQAKEDGGQGTHADKLDNRQETLESSHGYFLLSALGFHSGQNRYRKAYIEYKLGTPAKPLSVPTYHK
ncbi:delta-like protein 4 [Lates japonicus]|uniref:Delta-like protein 4 n=1 Tax=Lates japonicus TaxID=270547 RepID=A0AAD3MU50_LATJO|nr:delta-like protein 4 [Lates japonicus]